MSNIFLLPDIKTHYIRYSEGQLKIMHYAECERSTENKRLFTHQTHFLSLSPDDDKYSN